MKINKIWWLIILSLALSACAHRPRAVQFPSKIEKPKFTIPLGEKINYSIRWLGFEVGTAQTEVKEIVQINGRDAYHVEVKVRSNRLISLIYPVRDEHHSYIDVEHLYSLRYEKKLKEGTYEADDLIEYDQINHKARYESRRNGTIKEMLIPKDVQDQLSCTYWFRMQEMKPGDRLQIPVNVDEKNWNLEVQVQAWEELEVDGFGRVIAIRAEPLARFHGLFVRKGRAWGWMGTDHRRIPLLMKTEIPILGSIEMVITEYKYGDDHIKA